MITATQAMDRLLKANPGHVVTHGCDGGDCYIFVMLDKDQKPTVDAYKAVRKSDGEIFNYMPGDLMEFYDMMLHKPIRLEGMVDAIFG